MTNMHNDDDGDEIDLTLFVDEPVPYVPAPPPAGDVDVTAKLGGVPVRAATFGEEILLTVAGVDGMATVALSVNDAELLINMLAAGQADIRARRRR